MASKGQHGGAGASATDMSVVILYGRAALDRQQNVAQIAARLNAAGERTFVPAWEDLTGPSIPDVLEDLLKRGVRQALVVPVAFPADPSLGAWLAGALNAWRLEHADGDFDLRIAPPVEQFLDVAAAVEAAVAAAPERLRPVAEVKPAMGKPGWTDVPEHARQVFFCLGARCAHRRALPLYQHMRRIMKNIRPLNSGPQRAMCVRASCLYPCNQGPLLIVQPDGVWYGRLDETVIERIVQEHLLEGKPVAEAIVHRQKTPTDDTGNIQ
ncbi:(2Fe-2S) ferredoxin [Camelimonas lactis]|uniref:(2Fe-2S) ferredoxin n=2 Tax=Camelimonas lactis TaxID=659006 RepID=A0A4R2GVZ4_9HYPH|nr:(2Fe-2S) ferredoxin [Camelimonas lactis]